MPSEKALQAKQEVVAQLKSKLDGAVAGVLVDYRGITVTDDTKLRRELREAGIDYAVVKNTLLRRALEGTEYSEMASVLENTTAFAVSHEDPVAAAKILSKFAEDSKGTFAIKAGFVEGKVLDVPGVTVTYLADMLGCKRETLSRAMKILQNDNLVKIEGKKIYIKPDELSLFFKN